MELFVTVVYGSRPCIISIVTRTSILNVNSGPRPAFEYNGIWYNSFKLVYGGPLLSIRNQERNRFLMLHLLHKFYEFDFELYYKFKGTLMQII